MRFLIISQKKILLPFISLFLILSFTITPISLVLEVKKAEAQLTVFDPTNWVPNWGTFIQTSMSAISDAATAAGLDAIVTKEYILDNLVWPLINNILQEMIRSTTRWVRSGFQGSPAFVTDLEGFLLNVADITAGNFIWGTPLNMLCSPFSLNVRLALDFQYRSTKLVAQCRLSSVFNNINGFANNSFMNGGWNTWYNVALVPNNNPYGAMHESRNGLYLTIAGRQASEKKLLDFGNGFFSKLGLDGNITAPGKVIEAQLNHTLGLSGDRIAVADELNELVGALFAQLALEAISGAGGLLGLDSPYQYQGNTYDSYFSAMSAQNATVISGTQSGNPPIATALTIERQFLTTQNTIVSLITDASLYKDRVYGDTNQCSGDLTTSLQNQLATAQQQVQTSNSIINVLSTFLTDYTALQNVNTPQATLNAIIAKYNATTILNAQTAIMSQFLQYQSSGVLHGATDSININQVVIPGIQREIQNFTNSINEDCDFSNDNDSD